MTYIVISFPRDALHGTGTSGYHLPMHHSHGTDDRELTGMLAPAQAWFEAC